MILPTLDQVAAALAGKPLPKLDKVFWSRVQPHENGCWMWKGSIKWNGYGLFRRRPAHRLAYEILVCPVRRGLDLV